MPEKMQAVTLRRGDYGPPADALRLEAVPTPALDGRAAGRLLVSLLATGPNFNTNFASLGLPVPVFGRADPAELHIPGSDGVGIVVDAGDAVEGAKLGAAVLLDSWADGVIRGYETHDGFNAQFAQVDPVQAIPVPARLAHLPPERLGALLLTYGTAYRAVVERLRVGPGDSLLVMGGGKGTSYAACQIGRDLGARVLLVGSNVELMRSLVERGFADGYVDRRAVPPEAYGVVDRDEGVASWTARSEGFRDAVREANGGRLVDCVFDHTGGRTFPLLVSALAPGGRLAFFGATGSGVKGEYKQTFFYAGRRLVMDARWVWMRQKQVLFRTGEPEEILAEIGLPPGRHALVWGADAHAREFVQALLRRAADVAVFAPVARDPAGVQELRRIGLPEERIIDVDGFDLPADMPDPLLDEGAPNPAYDREFLQPARRLGRRLWSVWGGRISPDLIVERTEQSTLHFSAFLAKNYDGSDVLETGYVVARGPYDLTLAGSHMYGRQQAREVVRLLAEGRLVMEEADLDVTDLAGIPRLQQQMLEGTMTKSKGVALVQGDRPGRPIADYEAAYLGRLMRRAQPGEERFLNIWLLDGVALVQIERPAALNALSRPLLDELDGVITELQAGAALEGERVRGLVLMGSGRAFMAGADVAGFVGASADEVATLAGDVNRVYRALESLPLPVVALVEGFAFGGGNELAMSAHYRLAGPGALFAQPEVKLGIFPGYGGMQRLPRLVGPEAAARLCANGEPVGPHEALALGLVDEIVAPATALRAAFDLARRARPAPRPWDRLGREAAPALDELLGRPEVAALVETPLADEAAAGDRTRARRAAAGRAIEAMTYGIRQGFDAGLDNDARLFGETVASGGGQEWIGRFLDKDPAQAGEVRLL